MKAVAAAVSLSFLYCLPAASQVSATASPVSNSSGSVVNQAVQIVPGQYMRQSVGSGIQCDGATLNISPFLSTTHSYGSPNNEYYGEPVYDNSDNFGLVDPETGIEGPDGIPDRPGHVLYVKQMRTGYRQNFSTNAGITATFSIPLDWGPINLCKDAQRKQVALYEQQLANRRLDYELARLKNCATALREGYGWKPDSPFYPICADVILKPKPIEGHTHPIIYPERASDREWLDSDDAESPAAAVKIPVSPYGRASD